MSQWAPKNCAACGWAQASHSTGNQWDSQEAAAQIEAVYGAKAGTRTADGSIVREELLCAAFPHPSFSENKGLISSAD